MSTINSTNSCRGESNLVLIDPRPRPKPPWHSTGRDTQTRQWNEHQNGAEIKERPSFQANFEYILKGWLAYFPLHRYFLRLPLLKKRRWSKDCDDSILSQTRSLRFGRNTSTFITVHILVDQWRKMIVILLHFFLQYNKNYWCLVLLPSAAALTRSFLFSFPSHQLPFLLPFPSPSTHSFLHPLPP